MGSSSDQVTQTEPFEGFRNEAIRGARNLAGVVGADALTAGLSNEEAAAITLGRQKALQRPTLLNTQQDLAQRTLAGEFLRGPGQAQFDAAAMPAQRVFYDTLSQIGSGATRAGGSGRGATQALQSRARQDFADSLNRMAFQNYQQERQLQTNVLGSAGQIYGQQFAPEEQLTRIGLAERGFRQEALDRNIQAQFNLLSLLSGQGGQTQTTSGAGPNPMAGAIGGAATGAAAGSYFGPYGTAAGAVIGGGLGYLGAS
jgi:hypothetical protein